MKAIIHVHTSHSFDSFVSVQKLVDKAIENEIDLLCITDHDTIAGAKEAQNYAQIHHKGKIQIIIGAEFSTEWGDIIGLNIKENIASKNADEVIENIKKQGGLVLLPHPFDSHKNVDYLAEKADAIEVFNSRSTPFNNQKALDLAVRLNKPQYVASDAHFLSDSMLSVNYFEGQSDLKSLLLNPNKHFETAYSKAINYSKSQFIKGFKQRNIKVILYSAKMLLLKGVNSKK